MKVSQLARRGLAVLLAVAPALTVIPAQTDDLTDGRTEAGRTAGVPVKSVKTADDPSIPRAGQLTPDTDSRLFVESFLRALFTDDVAAVYDTYTHSQFQAEVTRATFKTEVKRMRQALGKLDRLALRYLRDEVARYDGADGGWATYVMVTERDPRVNVRVDFRRSGDGFWRVYGYALESAQMERLARARQAAEAAGGDEPEPEEPAPAP